jgi:Domain of unknown function (DUF5615)
LCLSKTVKTEQSLFVRLLLDENVQKGLASGLRLRHFDVMSVHELSRLGLSDEAQLIYAASQGCSLFTYNQLDYLKLHQDWLHLGKTHSGIILSDQVSVREALRRLLHLLNQIPSDEMQNQIWWLQSFR